MKLRVADCELVFGYETAAALTLALLLDRGNRIAACLIAALLHELGHILMMRLFREKIRRVSVRLFDVLIEAGDAPSLVADVWITLGGVMMNFACALLLFPFWRVWSLPHLALGCFNLMPVLSLDGGHLLGIILQRRFSPAVCRNVLRISTFVFLLPLFTAGLYLLLNSGYNYSLLAISLYLTAVLFLKS